MRTTNRRALAKFAATLLRLRKQRCVSGQWVADATGMARMTIHYLEHGRREPSLTTLIKLAALSSPFHLASRAHQRQARLVEKLRWRLSTLAHLPPPGGPQLYPLTFTIGDNGTSITCKRCERTSHNEGDVEQHYCSHCKMFHDDIWPPAREGWINSYSE